MDEKRLDRIVDQAEGEFWISVARQTGASSGDLDPLDVFTLRRAMRTAVRAWLDLNVPKDGGGG